MVNTVNTMVNTGVHTQPTVFHERIHLVNTVNTYSGKDWWGDTAATRPVVDSAQALQWGKGVHGVHRAESGSDYIRLPVNPSNRRYSLISMVARSRRYRDYRRYRTGPPRRWQRGGARSPGISRCTEKFTRETRFPTLPALPPFPRLPALPRGHEQ